MSTNSNNSSNAASPTAPTNPSNAANLTILANIRQLEADIDELKRQSRRGKDRFNDHIQNQQERNATHSSSLDSVQYSINLQRTRMDNLSDSQRQVNEAVVEIRNQVVTISTNLATVTADLALVTTNVAALNTNVAALNTNVAALNANVATIGTGMDDMKVTLNMWYNTMNGAQS